MTTIVQLVYKLRVMGMNAVFRMRLSLTVSDGSFIAMTQNACCQVGDNLIVGVATGTAVYSPAMPPPPVLQVRSLSH